MHFIMGKISNVTNSTDPQLINSRTFVGNLNTFVLTKDDIESIFQRYGRIIGISMHKGYAFVQYKTEQEARNAVAGEDQRIYANQPIDVNLAAEPKPNRPSRKRPHGAGAEWDYYYNTPVRPLPPPPPLKRPRADLGALMAMSHLKPSLLPLRPGVGPPAVTLDLNSKPNIKRLNRNHSYAGKSQNETPDILICGNCKQVFPDIEKLTSHKQIRCKLRFICKCDENSMNGKDGGAYVCATCQGEYTSAWELCQHVQNDHGVAIYQTKVDNSLFENNDDSKSSSSTHEEEIEEKQEETKTPEVEETTVSVLHEEEEMAQGNGTVSTDEELETPAESAKAPDDVTDTSNDAIDISDL